MKAKILRMDSSDISVYGEAKGEYTRQLCVFLVPSLESYFLELLEEAKKDSPTPQKVLWHFQNLLQSIPDWNQDKVVRETDLIQKDCKCDYLEELLTAVFIAHTKVLSAIRLTTKQKKLQITIPKIDHFLHRVLSDSARSLWTNAFLFADTNSIEKQKNLRQVSSLLQESVLQGIRGLLPVKSILREYLYDNDKDDALSIDDEEEKEAVAAVEAKEAKEDSNEEAKEEAKEASEDSKEEAKEAVEDSTEANEAKEDKEAKEAAKEDSKEAKEAAKEEAKEEVVSSVVVAAPEPEVPTPIVAPVETPVEAAPSPMIYIDTKPSVTFSQEHVMFDSDNLENNEIQDIPFAEAENREDELDSLLIMDEILPMDSDEILS